MDGEATTITHWLAGNGKTLLRWCLYTNSHPQAERLKGRANQGAQDLLSSNTLPKPRHRVELLSPKLPMLLNTYPVFPRIPAFLLPALSHLCLLLSYHAQGLTEAWL